MASGKQILIHFLKKYSLQKTKKEDLIDVSEDIRVGFLLHGSTPKEMWQIVDTIEWGEETADESDEVINQGLRIKDKNISLPELFDNMTWESEHKIPKRVAKRFPELTQSEYYAATRIMGLIFSSIEWKQQLTEVENGGKLDSVVLDRYLKSYKEKLGYYREDPENYI